MRPLVFVSLLLFVSICLGLFMAKAGRWLYREWSVVHDVSGGGKILAGPQDFVIYIQSTKTANLTADKQIRNALGSRNVTDFIPPKVNSILINWHTSNLALKSGPIAIILVATTAEEKLVRVQIRKTWYTWSEMFNVKIVFFMGLPKDGDLRNVFLESTTYDDIILDAFEESFHYLPLKTLRMFKWFTEFYEGSPKHTWPKYLVKMDQDVFINIPNVVGHLLNVSGPDYMAGSLHTNSKVTRKLKSKYFTPTDVYGKPVYPPYLGGACYFLSSDLVSKIFYKSYSVPLFHLEDVYISGMIANKSLGIPLRGISPKIMIESTKELQTAIRYKNNIWASFSYHPVDLSLMDYLFDIVNRYVDPNSATATKAGEI